MKKEHKRILEQIEDLLSKIKNGSNNHLDAVLKQNVPALAVRLYGRDGVQEQQLKLDHASPKESWHSLTALLERMREDILQGTVYKKEYVRAEIPFTRAVGLFTAAGTIAMVLATATKKSLLWFAIVLIISIIQFIGRHFGAGN